MKKKVKEFKNYTVRILDFKYKSCFRNLCFNYIYYKVEAKHESSALKKAQALYMRGEKGEFSESLPILLELFSIEGVA